MPPRVRRTLVAALGAGVLVAGCSSGSVTPSARNTPSTSATTRAAPSPSSSRSPSPAPTVERPPAAPRPVPGRAGQRAFARHVMDLWGYALRTNDVKPLAALGAGKKACAGCAALGRELAQRRRQGWTVDFPGVDVRKLTVANQGDVRVARAKVDIAESDSFNADGSFRNTNPAHAGATFVVQMRFVSKRYRLVSFTVS